MNNRSIRFARTMGEAFKTPEWSNPIEGPQQGRRLSSRTLWIAAFVIVWALWGVGA